MAASGCVGVVREKREARLALCSAAVPFAHAQVKVCFGNLHSHPSHRDGSGSPDEAYRLARQVAGLAFLATTEHRQPADRRAGQDERRQALCA